MSVFTDKAEIYKYSLTKWALIGSSLFQEPFTLLFNSLSFILLKDLGASPFELALLVAVKPIAALISFYWSSYVINRKNSLKNNVIISGILARIPFLFVPFFGGVKYLIFAAAMYMLFSRGGIPAWMEILKINFPKQARDKLFSLSYVLAYIEGIFLSFGIGTALDSHEGAWRSLFCISALLGLFGVGLQAKVPLLVDREEEKKEPFSWEKAAGDFWKKIISPWKLSVSLMRTRPDFAKFQIGFMIGGSSLMFMMGVLPLFFVEDLGISHRGFSVGRLICMGLGVLLSSSFWTRALRLYSLNQLAATIIFLFALFPAALLISKVAISWFYIAYFLYGIAQGGSHVIWHLSGPTFAGKEDSSLFSGVNLVMVGIRGMIFPFLGSALAVYSGPVPVLVIGMLVCFYGGYFMMKYNKKEFIRSAEQ